MKAIADTGNNLVAAVDQFDSVGILDRYFADARFFTEIERFDRHLEKLRRRHDPNQVEYVTVCTPNYLHDAHVRLALRVKAHAICEKPLVISPWNLDQLVDLEAEHGRRVYTILQLRVHPDLIKLKEALDAEGSGGPKKEVVLTYTTRRGRWYHVSWKGVQDKSGGLAMNIGIHFFDMLMWLFGGCEQSTVHLYEPDKLSGYLELERARVKWFLSVDGKDLPEGSLAAGKSAFRSITIDGEEMEFSNVFADLHTRVYERILAGNGFGIEDARPSIELVHRIRTSRVERGGKYAHPKL